MTLSEYLRSQKITTGPLRKNTRHSHLTLIKTILCGGVVTFGYKSYNNFGSALHEVFLLGKTKLKLSPGEEVMLSGMIAALRANPIVTQLMEDTIREKRKHTVVHGVKLSYTPDAKKKPHIKRKSISDLKSTACTEFQDFVDKAFEYGYFRQGETYTIAENADDFYDIGITKSKPHKVFILHLQAKEHAARMRYVAHELKMLLYFYMHYGTFLSINV